MIAHRWNVASAVVITIVMFVEILSPSYRNSLWWLIPIDLLLLIPNVLIASGLWS